MVDQEKVIDASANGNAENNDDANFVVKQKSEPNAPHFFEIIEPTNKIKRKVGDAKGFSDEAVRKAETAIRELGSNYINDLIYDVQELQKAYESFIESGGEKKIHQLQKTSWYAHEIKSQAGTYGYPFVSRVARSLCYYMHELEDRNAFDEFAEDIIRAHISTLMVVARKRIHGDGEETGVLVSEGLEVAVKKHLTRDPKFIHSNVRKFLQKLTEHMEGGDS